MKYLSVEEFSKYIVSHKEHYLYNERYDLAFRGYSETRNSEIQVYRKHRGKPEVKIRYDDYDYADSWFMTTIMTKEEYENF